MTDREIIFLTHAEVKIRPDEPVGEWALSDVGQARHAAFASDARLARVSAIYTSAERKAREGAAPVEAARSLKARAVTALGENDRTATGFLPPDAFEVMADRFFANPDDSVRGWERARAAQARVVAAVRTLADLDDTGGDLLIVAHGAVGALLRCHLLGREITRDEDQAAGGGQYFVFDLAMTSPPSDWVRI